MHRKTTSRRENKRILSKRERAAKRQAINGGHSKIVRDSWAYKPIQPPIIDEVVKGHPKRKGRVRKVLCPTSPVKKHQWLKDRGIFESYWAWDPTPEERPYKMCVHCGKIKTKSRYTSQWYETRDRLLRSA